MKGIAQILAISVALVGLGLIAAGGFSLIVDAQTRAAEEAMRPEDFDFVVTLTPPPTHPPQASLQSGAVITHEEQLPAAQSNAAPSPTPALAPLPAELPTRIVIPAINLDAPITPVQMLIKAGDPAAAWAVPNQRAAGWLNTTAQLGQAGNMVLDGHHNVHGRVFERLKDLTPGDLIVIYGPSQVMTYTLAERHLLLENGEPLSVRLEHARYIAPTGDTRLTLVTCWPPTDYSHRLILIAIPTANSTPNNPADKNRRGQ